MRPRSRCASIGESAGLLADDASSQFAIVAKGQPNYASSVTVVGNPRDALLVPLRRGKDDHALHALLQRGHTDRAGGELHRGYRRSFASRRSPVRLRPLRSLACFAQCRSAPLP